jgi:serine/threonine protein kinase/tetratricopeptide (TPR) repeat protein
VQPSEISNRNPDFGPRYRVEGILGEGGMGTVYKAWDNELERTVALKLVRHDLTRDPSVSQRFKQELLLASKVSHRNVLRIHDLGDGPGDTKFISMAYIEGQDLSHLLKRERKLPVERAVKIARQLCAALDAAHAEGVVHRDLKPQNVLIDQHDHIYVSDFGLAKSLESDLGMTQTGQLLGTPRYMSPEQAEIGPVDHRSDLYAFGLILCEMVTGSLPFEPTQSTMQMMYQRVHGAAKDPRQLNPDIPDYLARIIQKCLERNVTQRYQSAAQILADLDAGHAQEVSRRSWITLATTRFTGDRRKRVWSAVVAILALLAGGLAVWRTLATNSAHSTANVPAAAQVSLAILPFRNASGDASLDWLGSSLAEWLSTDVGQSSALRTVSSERLHQILQDLRISADTNLDSNALRRLAEFSNAQTVVWGQYARLGEQIRIDATLRDLKQERTATLTAEAPNQGELLGAVNRLAQAIRENLSFSESDVKELQAQAFIPSSKSLQALRNYNEGLQLMRLKKDLEAQKKFEVATKEDPEFALAYAKLGQILSRLGYDSEAEQASGRAVELSSKLPQQEKIRIIAGYALVKMDYAKAIESYEQLAKVLPEDVDIQLNLAQINEQAGLFDEARAHYGKVLEADPKSLDALLGIGRVEIKNLNPQGGLDYLNRALTLAIQFENEEGKAAVLQAMAVAYARLDRLDEALRNYQESLTIKRRLGDKRGMAASLDAIAQVQERLGKPDLALKSYGEAEKLEREIGDRAGLGDTLTNMGALYHDRGQHDRALILNKEALKIQRELGNEGGQGLCLNNIGSSYYYKGQYEDAATYFQQALQLREKSGRPDEIAETVHNLAETDVNMGQYDRALSYYLRALELYRGTGDKRGAAIESSGIGTLFVYQGRYGAAVASKQEALKAFRELGDRSFWMVDILSSYGDVLIQAGRSEEAQKNLDEAMNLARELRNEAFVAQILDYEGDVPLIQGNYRSARDLYQRALQTASRAGDRGKVLHCRFDLARLAVKEGRNQAAAKELEELSREVDSLGLKHLVAECSAYRAEALMNARDYARAQQELNRAMASSEKLGLRATLARSHYLMGAILRLTGKEAEATHHYRETVRLLEEIRKEPDAANVLQRADLNSIYTESVRWSQDGKGQ